MAEDTSNRVGGEGPASPARAAGERGDAEAAGGGSESNAPPAPPGGPPDKKDRKAYLEEQIARLQASQRNLRWLVIGSAILMIVLWARNGGMLDKGGYVSLGLVVIGLFAALVLRGAKRGPRP